MTKRKVTNGKPYYQGSFSDLFCKGLTFLLMVAVVTIANGATYYVDANNGDDTWDGTAETHVEGSDVGPRKTLAKIVEVANQADDVIIALPGRYDSGECVDDERGRSRVIIPPKVTLESRDGAEKTFIIGAKSTHKYADEYGRGTNAVRCVQFGDGNSKVVGFTLCGGRTLAEDRSAGYGGALHNKGYVYDCIISNNIARRGGALGSASTNPIRCYRTKFFDNKANYGSLSYQGARFYNCLIKNESSYAIYANKAGIVQMYSSTVLIEGGGSTCFYDDGVAYNSLFIGKPTSSEKEDKTMNFTNCVFTVSPSSEYAVVDDNCKVYDRADLKLDSNLYPLIDSPLVDAANKNLYSSEVNKGDIRGGQRVYNGTSDIGCYEYDWRDVYAGMLSGTRLSLSAASQYVTKDSSNLLKIGAGHSLVGKWRSRGGILCFNVNVSGDGSFTFAVDGEPLSVVDKATSGLVSVKIPSGDHTFTMSCTKNPNASALIGPFDEKIGTVFSVK